MKASGRLGAIVVAMLLVLAAMPAAAGSFGRGAAGHRAGARAIGHRAIVVVEPTTPSAFPQPVDPWRIWGLVNQRHLFIRRSPVFANPAFIGSFGSAAFVPSIVGVPSFADYAPSNVYIPSDAYAPAAPAYAPAPPPVAAPPPLPTVVDYPTGRFELRGDGMTVPYAWIWIPKAPPPPPEPPAPPVASQPPSPSATGPEVRPSAEPGEAFKWTDEQGVTHWTNKPNKIPQRYRSQAQPVS